MVFTSSSSCLYSPDPTENEAVGCLGLSFIRQSRSTRDC